MLSGTRIIEIEGLGPGPFAGMLLADLGADVIVAHRKDKPSTPGVADRAILDRGKRSIAVDLKDPGDVAMMLDLIETADAVIEGFRPGVMEKLGLGPQDCQARNPALVYGRMTGWGQDGALSHAAGHDLNYIAMSGAAWYASPPDTPPFTPPTLVGDIGGGALYLVVGILSGILRARASGQGTVVDAAIYDGSAHMMNLLMTLRQAKVWNDSRGHSVLDGPHWSRCYRCADGGYVSVQCLEPKFYAQFLDLLELSEDPDFQRQNDPSLWPALAARLEALFATRPRAEWEALFLGTDACVAPVLSPEEAARHPVNNTRGTWHMEDGLLQAAPAPRFAGRSDWAAPSAPERGAHDAEIRAELAQKG